MVGYTKPLYILPFDHKTSFIAKLFGYDGLNLSEEQKQEVVETRQIIYEGFKKAVHSTSSGQKIPKEYAALLTDEEFGDGVLRDSVANGYVVMVTTEKSGQKEFTFEYGDDFGVHIEKYKPTFAKALVRYNPEDDTAFNQRQLTKLKLLSDFCQKNNYKFLIEPLVPATENQLAQVSNDKHQYDMQVRPGLTVKMIGEFQQAGIIVDVWKLEGFEEKKSYEAVVVQTQIHDNGVGVVVLGRGGTAQEVQKWLEAGAQVPGVIGFAVGRTVFYDALDKYHNAEISKQQAVDQIAQNFIHFYDIFEKAKTS